MGKICLVFLFPCLRFVHGGPFFLPSPLQAGLFGGLPLFARALASDAAQGPLQGPFAGLPKIDLDARLQQGTDVIGARGIVHVRLLHLFRTFP